MEKWKFFYLDIAKDITNLQIHSFKHSNDSSKYCKQQRKNGRAQPAVESRSLDYQSSYREVIVKFPYEYLFFKCILVHIL